MEFQYNSVVSDHRRDLFDDIVVEMKKYLISNGFSKDWTRGYLQDIMLEFRYKGERLLINHLEPMFVYVAQKGELWND